MMVEVLIMVHLVICKKKIDGADEGSTILLENNYIYDFGFSTDGISINKTLTINGNGYVIDALGQSRIFNVNSASVTLNDIVFKNENKLFIINIL